MKRAPKKRVEMKRARSEQLFFTDPAVDGLMGMLMTLATDHFVLRDRVKALEEELIRSGHVRAAALSTAPTGSDAAASSSEAAAFATELLRPLLGVQEAVGAEGRFSLKQHRRRTR